MKKYIVCSLCFWILCSSCNDWLDVKPQGQTEEEDMYTTYEGFKDALTGCYVKLKDRDLYGEGLTMSLIESLAQLWDPEPVQPGTRFGFAAGTSRKTRMPKCDFGIDAVL